MRHSKQIYGICIATAAMALLIFDTKTAVTGAAAGIDLCVQMVLPSLFPFFFVTTYLNHSLLGTEIPGLRTLARWLHVPNGGDSLLLLGLIGGYPVGAQLISDAYNDSQINKETACILIGYCSNAGPAFIFGVTGSLFSSIWTPFCLWGIHIISALLTGFLLPRPSITCRYQHRTSEIALPMVLQRSIRICASVCGWIIVFKVILSYLDTWLQPIISNQLMIIICGIMELSNGCIQLSQIPNEASRFILCAVFLSFGGLCVLLQTASVTGSLGLGAYIPGKLIQTCISILLSLLFSLLLFHDIPNGWGFFLVISVMFCSISKRYAENKCGNPAKNTV